MGFEVYFYFGGEAGNAGIPRTAIRSLFPVNEDKSEPDYWSIDYDNKENSNIGVTPLESDPQMLSSLYVDRPCGDSRLWESMLSILRMGSVTMFWPGSPLIIANATTAGDLPEDMIESLGQPKVVGSAEEILSLLHDT